MATLPPSVQAGQSNAPTQFNSSGFGVYNPNMITGGSPNFNNPDAVIENAIKSNLRAGVSDIFPLDLPKYHFSIIQNNWSFFEGANITNAMRLGKVYQLLRAERMFKLPFPRELQDKSEVKYNDDFNPLANMFASINQASGGSARTAVQSIEAIGGVSIGNFKAITLQAPDFKTHQLSWQFAAKNYAESRNLQRIIYALKKGMAPTRGGGSGYTGTGSELVLGFPKVYTLYFTPNAHWLFKFKPCVLTALVVDYAGGNPVPAFLNGPTKSTFPKENPPESITIATNWLELEYWLEDDYKLGGDGLPVTDPLSDIKHYQYVDNRVYGDMGEYTQNQIVRTQNGNPFAPGQVSEGAP